MDIRIGECLEISEPSETLISWCKGNLVINNPEYHKAIALGRWAGNIPETICLYSRVGEKLVLPFGCLRQVWGMIKDSPYKLDFGRFKGFDYKGGINLYPYQENALKAILDAKNGIVVMPCGSGKSNIGIAAIEKIGGRALWLTHTKELLTQSMERAKAILGCDASSYGTITGGKVDIGEGLTFATVQTMRNLDLAAYKYCWDVIVTDECHLAVGSPTKAMQFYKVLSSLSARYKIGLTATPYRADKLENTMFALIGGVIFEAKKEDVACNLCQVKVRFVETGYMPDFEAVLAGDGTINYAALVDDLTGNEGRLKAVMDVINTLEGATIVLANRVKYLERLAGEYRGRCVCLSSIGASKKAKEARQTALEKLGNGEIDCIFATYQLAAVGLDCPQLRNLVLATPEKDKAKVSQSVGRVGRRADGKEYGMVIDFVDSFAMFKGWKKKREGYYKKLDIEVVEK